MKLRRTFLAKSPWVFVATISACTTKPPAPRAPEPNRPQPTAVATPRPTEAAREELPLPPASIRKPEEPPKPKETPTFDLNSEQGKGIVALLHAFLDEMRLRTKDPSRSYRFLGRAEWEALADSLDYLQLPDPPRGSKDAIAASVKFAVQKAYLYAEGTAVEVALKDDAVHYGSLVVFLHTANGTPRVFQVEARAPNGIRLDSAWIAEQKKPLDPEKVQGGRLIGALSDLNWQVPAIAAEIERNPLFHGIFTPKRREDLGKVLWGLAMYMTKGRVVVPASAHKRMSKDKKLLRLLEISRRLADVYRRTTDLPPRIAEPIHGYFKSQPNSSVQLSALALWLNRDNVEHIRGVFRDLKAITLRPDIGGFWRTELEALDWLSTNTTLVPELRARLAELKAEASVIKVTASELLAEYKANEVRADGEYKGKIGEVTGIVGAVRDTTLGGISVDIGTGKRWELQSVTCYVSREQAEHVAKLNKGDRAKVRGRVQGLAMNVLLEDCRLISYGG